MLINPFLIRRIVSRPATPERGSTFNLRSWVETMLDRWWRRIVWPYVMRDADRLIEACGRGAYGMARIGATANQEVDGKGHWSAVAREIGRRLDREPR